MVNETKLTELYPGWMNSGIFADLNSFDVPWKDKNISQQLDIAYYGNRSGDKIISTLLEKIDPDNRELTAGERQTVANMIFAVCGDNWSRLWNTLSLEYNPIENVDAYLTETTDSSGNRDTNDTITSTGTDTHVASGTDTMKRSGSDTHTVDGTETTDNTGTVGNSGSTGTDRNIESGIAGFNSGDYSNSDNQVLKETVTANNTETRNTKDATTTHNTDAESIDTTDATDYGRTDTETKDLTDKHTGNEQSTGKVEHTLHRHGNIGVTTSQQMIEAERELWKWYFFDVVFADVDKFLTISVY